MSTRTNITSAGKKTGTVKEFQSSLAPNVKPEIIATTQKNADRVQGEIIFSQFDFIVKDSIVFLIGFKNYARQ